MPAFIHTLRTATGPHACTQELTRDQIKRWTPDPRQRRLIHAIYQRSGIQTRHSVCPDFLPHTTPTLFHSDTHGTLLPPSTAARNRIYAHWSKKIAVELAHSLLSDSPGFSPQDVTHIIFASCTGFTNPGPDYHIVRELGLPHTTQRYTLGFMGCYAAFPALRMAEQFCAADPNAVVLVLCLELCTLHLQVHDHPDSILAHSLFADGAAAALVSSRTPPANRPALRLDSFSSALLPAGETDMAWEIGDHGFNIVLSSYVPDLLAAHIAPLLTSLLSRHNTHPDDIALWAVHPGGRAILDKIERALALPPNALHASRSILRDYGNMSSATILFVLKLLLDSPHPAPAPLCAMAFGPGLTIETALMQRIGPAAPEPPALLQAPPIQS